MDDAKARDELADAPTCGRGLAAHAPLPAKMAEWLTALAENLRAHQASLDTSDAGARHELEAYQALVRAYHDIADSLGQTARQMAGYRDLPMGRHDESALMGPGPREAFAHFVVVEEELLRLLQHDAGEHRQMLKQWQDESSSG